MWLFAWVFCAAALIDGGAARAEPAAPKDALAWWRFDPTGFAAAGAPRAQREAILMGLRAAVSSRVVGDSKAAAVLEGLLVASEVGAAPHTLCVLDFEAIRPPEGTGIDIERMQIVLELRTMRDHVTYMRTIKAVLIDAPRAALGEQAPPEGRQRIIDLPSGRKGGAYREPGWEDWREISWCSSEEGFTVGLGAGSLERWFAAKDIRHVVREPRPWDEFQQAVDEARPEGGVFLEAYASVRALRAGFPEAFVTGRIARVLTRLGLIQARDVMIHGRRVRNAIEGAPPMLAFDATWRIFGDDGVHRLALSESEWPAAELNMPVPPGSYVIVAKTDWEERFELALDLMVAGTQETDMPERIAARHAWLTHFGAETRTLLGSLKPWLIVSDTPTPLLPIPGSSSFFAELREEASVDEAQRALGAMLSPFRDRVDFDVTRMWTYKVDPGGFVRIPAWGFAVGERARVLVGGWGPPVVAATREWVGKREGQ